MTDDDGNGREIGSEKADATADILDDLPPDEPLVVFARFHHDLDATHAAAKRMGRASCELSGRRNEIGSVWRPGPATVAAVQIHSGGVGVDLTAARYAAYFSVGFDGADWEQSLARLHRQGQTRKVTYIRLVGIDTVDEKVYSALAARQHVVKSVLGDLARKIASPPKFST